MKEPSIYSITIGRVMTLLLSLIVWTLLDIFWLNVTLSQYVAVCALIIASNILGWAEAFMHFDAFYTEEKKYRSEIELHVRKGEELIRKAQIADSLELVANRFKELISTYERERQLNYPADSVKAMEEALRYAAEKASEDSEPIISQVSGCKFVNTGSGILYSSKDKP